MQVNVNTLRELEADGKITLRYNDSETLMIANYTPEVAYSREWTPLLLQCRGLIMELDGTVVARPFEKFFNYEEHDSPLLDNVPFDVEFDAFHKMDGSLGILYKDSDGVLKISTRGSFNSDQAKYASSMLLEHYEEHIEHFKKELTYLFEIIFPENRIVVDYGDASRLTLLAVVNTETGKDDWNEFDEVNFPDKVDKVGGTFIHNIDGNLLKYFRSLENPNEEGFVLVFVTGTRVKIKFEEYVRLHRAISGVSSKSIWEYLQHGNNIEGYIDDVPDELYDWVTETADKLKAEFLAIKEDACIRWIARPRTQFCSDEYLELKLGKDKRELFVKKRRAIFATWAKDQGKFTGMLFCMYDERSYDHIIWKQIKPKHETPYLTS